MKNEILPEERIWHRVCTVSSILYSEELLMNYNLHFMYFYMMVTIKYSYFIKIFVL